jgi:hypothetical protein
VRYRLGVSHRPADTSPEAWAVMEEGIRRMTPQERVRRALALTIFTHEVALAGIRKRHPDETPREHKLRLAARYIDADTMRAAFGWTDDGHG